MRVEFKFAKVLLGCLCAAGFLSAQPNFEIDGMGFFKNRALQTRLAFLQSFEPGVPVDWDAALIEDSVFLLLEQLKREGFRGPVIEAQLLEDGESRAVIWKSPYSIQLDAYAEADAVSFFIRPGKLAYYNTVQIEGVAAIESEELERYFVPGGVLFTTRRAKVFTSENLDRRAGRVTDALIAMGYREAEVQTTDIAFDPDSGAVDVTIAFNQGPKHYVNTLTKIRKRGGDVSTRLIEVPPETVLTQEWEQMQRTVFRNEAFTAGYPDARIQLEQEDSGLGDEDQRHVDIRVIIDWGEPATLADARFKGDAKTRRPMLRRRLELEKGQPLDRLQLDEARRRLMGLGIYKNVRMVLDPETGPKRSAVYTLEPDVREELDLLVGWGSYEQLRAGLKWEHRNPFGRAHRYGVEAKQSLKSTRAQAAYYLPQLFGTEVLGYAGAEYNFREEISYDRRDSGISLGTVYSTAGHLRLTTEYSFFREEATREDASSFLSEENATVASLNLKISFDKRDDFLAPSSGWTVYGELKVANRALGGSVDFQKFECGASYHVPLSRSTILHLGLRGGAIISPGRAREEIPFNERFFSGGEHSVRGFREGAASPLDADGDILGAESYGLLNVELEQRVVGKFSSVLFLDSLVNSRDQFEGDSATLFSLGVGLRYRTVIGPLRLEYGHNLNPRAEDPDGTLHFSVGFPF